MGGFKKGAANVVPEHLDELGSLGWEGGRALVRLGVDPPVDILADSTDLARRRARIRNARLDHNVHNGS